MGEVGGAVDHKTGGGRQEAGHRAGRTPTGNSFGPISGLKPPYEPPCNALHVLYSHPALPHKTMLPGTISGLKPPMRHRASSTGKSTA